MVIDGQGSEFVFHGLIIPFLIENSQRIILRNLTVDWAMTFHSEGIVISSDESGVELEIPEHFPYKVVNGRFHSLGAGAEGGKLRNMAEFDAVRRETAFGAGDVVHIEEIAPRRIRFQGQFSDPQPTPGNIMVLTDCRRMCPAVLITESHPAAKLSKLNPALKWKWSIRRLCPLAAREIRKLR